MRKMLDDNIYDTVNNVCKIRSTRISNNNLNTQHISSL